MKQTVIECVFFLGCNTNSFQSFKRIELFSNCFDRRRCRQWKKKILFWICLAYALCICVTVLISKVKGHKILLWKYGFAPNWLQYWHKPNYSVKNIAGRTLFYIVSRNIKVSWGTNQSSLGFPITLLIHLLSEQYGNNQTLNENQFSVGPILEIK